MHHEEKMEFLYFIRDCKVLSRKIHIKEMHSFSEIIFPNIKNIITHMGNGNWEARGNDKFLFFYFFFCVLNINFKELR